MNQIIKALKIIVNHIRPDGEFYPFSEEEQKELNELIKEDTAEWIRVRDGIKVTEYKCSKCGRIVRDDTGYDVMADYPYCHCGCRMKGENQ